MRRRARRPGGPDLVSIEELHFIMNPTLKQLCCQVLCLNDMLRTACLISGKSSVNGGGDGGGDGAPVSLTSMHCSPLRSSSSKKTRSRCSNLQVIHAEPLK